MAASLGAGPAKARQCLALNETLPNSWECIEVNRQTSPRACIVVDGTAFASNLFEEEMKLRACSPLVHHRGSSGIFCFNGNLEDFSEKACR